MRFRFAVGLAGAALLRGSAALADSASASDVPDRFRIEAGGFRLGSDTELTFNTQGTAGRPPVSFEGLNLPDTSTRFYIEGFWRP
jgi:hypothetical protein